MISLYFHIPFCTKKCPYCHFYVIPDRVDLKTIFLQSIEREWDWRLPELLGKKVVSIYFGGGTPTLFCEGIAKILDKVRNSCLEIASDCEITVEGNPEEITLPLLESLLQAGVNRLSLGVQSLDDSSLQVLERRHSAQKAKWAIEQALKAGFQNISIDLMYDLPWQTETSWQSTLNQASGLPITHLSLYNLTLEPHTVFFKKKSLLEPVIPKPELSLKLLQQAVVSIERMGLERYEISAFAKKGFESRHNTGYWTARPFLGFGPSAFSYWNHKRFCNVANIQRYARALAAQESPVDFEEELPYPANLHERLAIELRLLKGVALPPLPPATTAILQELEQQGWLELTPTHAKLTPSGLLFYDSVAEAII